MSKQIIFNKSNYDIDQKRFVYELGGSVKLSDYEVALTSISIYNSFYNISSAYRNNVINFQFLDTEPVKTWTIPDGFYNVENLNAFIQSKCIEEGYYMTNSDGQYIYYFEVVINAVSYGIEFVFYPVAKSDTILTKPSNATWTYPTANITPKFIIPNLSTLGEILGHSVGTYGFYTGISTIKNTFTPSINKVSSIILNCNLIDNTGFSTNQTLYSFAVTESFGNNIKINPNNLIYNKISPVFNENRIIIQICDQTGTNVIDLLDTDVLIVLSFKEIKK